jgi:hypothetical protein
MKRVKRKRSEGKDQQEILIINLPYEILIHVMKWLSLKDAMNICRILRISVTEAYRYHDFKVVDKRLNGIIMSDIYRMIRGKEIYFNALRINTNFKIFSQDEAFAMACDFGFTELVQELIPTVNPDNFALVSATYKGHTDIVKILLKDKRIDLANDKYSCFQAAVSQSKIDIVKLLLEDSRCDPSDKNNQALRIAAYSGFVEIIELLLSDPRVNPADEENEAIFTSCSKGHTAIVKLLLKDSRVDPSAFNNGPIIIAASKGHVDIVKLLLSDGRVNAADENYAALKLAVKGQHHQVLHLLADHLGLDPHDPSEWP